jgi:hypothetical protein
MSLTPRQRSHQIILIVSFLPLCWLGMMAVHEFGHVLGAWFTGGTVTRVVLHPLTISRTDVSPNPQPLVVVWAGPVFGCLLPLLVFALVALLRWPTYLVRFFAGFCLIANGAYLGIGSFDRVGDAGDLLRHGAALWQLSLFGVLTVPAGIFLWHHQGQHFGLGEKGRPVSPLAAWGSLLALIVVAALEVIFSPLE